MTNIKDVAKLANVSVTTVSRVINNKGYVSIKTRNAVNNAIKQLDYHPNEMARAFSRQQSYILGLIVPNAAHPFFAELVRYTEQFAYEKGYKILVCNSFMDIDKEKDYIDMLLKHQVDGIIMASQTNDVESYKNLNLPIVAIDRKLSENIPYVSSDNYNGGIIATQHLIDCSCKELLHISGSLKIEMKSNERCDAFIDVCKKNNINYSVVEIEPDLIENFQYSNVIENILIEHPNVDGIFASADLIAATAVRACIQLGKRIPKDIKIVGFDDTIIASIVNPPITSIRQPISSICSYAVELILKQINKKIIPNQMVFPVSLIKRKTT